MRFGDYIKKLPDNPGIYFFYNKKGEIVYVGKATSLKSRVGSYFKGKRTSRPIEQMLDQVVKIRVQETDSVIEAVIAEANAIKKYLPTYNVLGKDSKSWNYLVITKGEYPQIKTLRQHDLNEYVAKHNLEVKNFPTYARLKKIAAGKKTTDVDIDLIFGPFPGLNAKETLKLLRRLFYYSDCQKRKRNTDKPCFYYQLGQCLGVCTKEITPKEYKQLVIQPLVSFLKGGKKQVIKMLEAQMKKAAKEHQYEEAARFRDQIASLKKIHDMALLNKSFIEDDIFDPEGFIVERIEGYDISNLGSTGIVGSMVVFSPAGPVKSQYRKFKIKTVKGQSDVDSLAEVLHRRLKHTDWQFPDVLLIDGGKPQVNKAAQVLRLFGVTLPIVGIAKGPKRKKNEFFLTSQDKSFVDWVKKNEQLLVQVRDEAHRFAITYQRSLRKINK